MGARIHRPFSVVASASSTDRMLAAGPIVYLFHGRRIAVASEISVAGDLRVMPCQVNEPFGEGGRDVRRTSVLT